MNRGYLLDRTLGRHLRLFTLLKKNFLTILYYNLNFWHFVYLLNPSQGCGVAGFYSSGHWARDKQPSILAHNPKVMLESPIDLTCMFCGRWEEARVPANNPHIHGENMQTPHIKSAAGIWTRNQEVKPAVLFLIFLQPAGVIGDCVLDRDMRAIRALPLFVCVRHHHWHYRIYILVQIDHCSYGAVRPNANRNPLHWWWQNRNSVSVHTKAYVQLLIRSMIPRSVSRQGCHVTIPYSVLWECFKAFSLLFSCFSLLWECCKAEWHADHFNFFWYSNKFL